MGWHQPRHHNRGRDLNTLGLGTTRLNKIVSSCTQKCSLGNLHGIVPTIKSKNIAVITPLVALSKNGIGVALSAGNPITRCRMIKYLSTRNCPSCRSTVTTMMVRYSSRLSAVNAVCSRCDYSMKWLVLPGNLSNPARVNLANPSIATRNLKSGPNKNLEVLSS